MQRKKIMKWGFIGISFLGFLIWARLFLADIHGLQRNIFFRDENDWFMDFYNVVYFSFGKTPYSWGMTALRNYLPISYMMLYPFSLLYPYDTNDWGGAYAARYSQLSGIAVGVFLVLSFGFLFFCLYKRSKGSEFEKIGMLLALFVSGVTIISFDRANEQILATAFLCIYLMTYDSKRRLLQHIGFISLAIAAAMKIYPAVFGMLLLYQKRYREAFITIIYGVLFAVVPFFWLEGSVLGNIKLFCNALKAFSDYTSIGIVGWLTPNIFSDGIKINNIIQYIICFIALFSAGQLRTEWKKILLITLVTFFVTSHTKSYCLLYLFYPIILFFNADYERSDWLYILGFILILSPLQYEVHLGIMTLTRERVISTVCIIMFVALIIEGFIERSGFLKLHFKKKDITL